MTTHVYTRLEVANMQAGMETRDTWSTAFVNDLPDSSFLLCFTDSKGTKQRYFPVKDASGKIDLPHLRNALARIPQASTLTAEQRAAAMTKAKSMAKNTMVSGGMGDYAGMAGSGRSIPAERLGMQARTFDLTLELRSDGDGRTLIGRAVPYGQTAFIPGGRERFVMGAFSRQISGGQLHTIKLHGSHTQRMTGDFPIGKTVSLSEQTDGLHGAWRLHDTPRGDEALHLVKTGEVTGLSIGFKPVDGGTKKGNDGAFERHAAHLDHVVLTTSPVYEGAQVMAVRSTHPIGGYRTSLLRARQVLDRVNAPG